jgi:hypothetical protein
MRRSLAPRPFATRTLSLAAITLIAISCGGSSPRQPVSDSARLDGRLLREAGAVDAAQSEVLSTIDGGTTDTLPASDMPPVTPCTPTNAGLPGPGFDHLAVSNQTSGVKIFAGSHDGAGVFASSDGGMTWSLAGLKGFVINDVVVDPTNPNTIYAGSDFYDLYVSKDGGVTWNDFARYTQVGSNYGMAIDPANTQNMYVGTGNGIAYSHDGGTTWTLSTTAGIGGGTAVGVVIDPPTTTNVWAAFNGNNGVNGVWESTDLGVTWNPVSNGLTDTATGLAWDPSSQTLYVNTLTSGVFALPAGATTWVAENTGITGGGFSDALTVNPVSGQLYVGGTSGVATSTNGGTSWTTYATGLNGNTVTSIVLDPKTSTTIYVGIPGSSGGGFAFTLDITVTWHFIPPQILVINVFGLGALPNGDLILGEDQNGLHYASYLSTDHATTWTSVYPINGAPTGLSVIGPDALIYGSNLATLDTKDGLTYTPIPINCTMAADVSGIANSIYWMVTGAASTGAAGFAHAATLAGTWTGGSFGSTVTDTMAVGVDGKNGQHVLIETDGGLEQTTNGGGSWALVSTAPTVFSASFVNFDPTNSQYIYLGTGSGLYVTTNGGTTWTQPTDLPAFTPVTAMAYDPTTAGHFVIIIGGKMWVTVDFALHWHQFAWGLPGTATAVTFDSGGALYLGTDGPGVFTGTTCP